MCGQRLQRLWISVYTLTTTPTLIDGKTLIFDFTYPTEDTCTQSLVMILWPFLQNTSNPYNSTVPLLLPTKFGHLTYVFYTIWDPLNTAISPRLYITEVVVYWRLPCSHPCVCPRLYGYTNTHYNIPSPHTYPSLHTWLFTLPLPVDAI